MCGCCVSECNSMEADPEFLGPAALAKAQRFVGDVRDTSQRERLKDLNGAHGIWDCTRCYFCNQRCPKGVDPRDAIAKLGAETFRHGITRDEGAKHAKVFTSSTYRGGYLEEVELVPRTIGPVAALMDVPLALRLARAGKIPNPLKSHKAPGNDQVKRLWKLLEEQAREHAGRRAASALDPGASLVKDATPTTPAAWPPVGEGARHLDACGRGKARGRAGRARVVHVLRRGRHPRGQARLLPAPERAHPRAGRGGRARHAADDLQRLHAQPAPGQQAPAQDPDELARVNANLAEVGARTYYGAVDVRHLLWEISEGDGYERFKQIAVRSLEGLKVAPFYGCQILRPSKLLGFEDPDRPQSLERLIEACGAEPIDYPAKIKCCGFPIVLAREDVALGEAILPLEQAVDAAPT